MDLDNIKKAWDDNTFTSSLTDDNIRHIIHKKGRTALSRLLWFEIIGLIIVLPFVVVPYLHALYLPRVPYPTFTKYFFIACCIISFFWQIYKVQLLKKINLNRIDLISGLKFISKYKLYIKREVIAAVFFLCILLGSFCHEYQYIISEQGRLVYYLFNLTMLVTTCTIMLLFYKYFYTKNIKNIITALEEIEEIEKDQKEESSNKN